MNKYSMNRKISLSLIAGVFAFLPAVTVVAPNNALAQWSAPSQTAPNGNISAPLNVSGTAQTKTGGLWINTGNATNGLLVQYGKVGIGNISPAYALDVSGDIRAQSAWLRNTGSAGWLNETWNGGWYMSDLSWVRSYLDKSVYTGGEMQAGTVRANTNLCIASDCRTSWPAGSLTGSGTTTYIPKWTSGTALGNSLLSDDGTTVTNAGSTYFTMTGSWFPYTNNWNYIRGSGTYINNVLYDEANSAYQTRLSGYTRLSQLYVDALYNYDWFRNVSAGQGIYNQATGKHFYSSDANYWNLTSNDGLVLRQTLNGTPAGYLYWDGAVGSNNFGLLSPNGTWKVRVDNSNTELYGNGVYAPSLYANIMYDRNNAGYYVQPSSVSILNDIRPNIMYDRANTSFYVQPSVWSRLHNVKADYIETPGGLAVTGSQFWVLANITSYFDGNLWVRGATNGGTGVVYIGDNPSNPNGSLTLYGSGSYQGSWSAASDRRLKTNIVTLPDALNKIQGISGVSFNWKSDGKASIGVIAQDVEKVYPDLVSTDPKTGMKSVEYEKLVAPLIEAVKEQQKQIEALKARIDILESSK